MYCGLTAGVAIPALNEEASIGLVVGDLRSLRNADGTPVIDDVVVCDNGSSDATAARASDAGARIALERRKGYGSACLAAIAKLRDTPRRHADPMAVGTPGNRSSGGTPARRVMVTIRPRGPRCWRAGTTSTTTTTGS